jgi:hypothetical protein
MGRVTRGGGKEGSSFCEQKEAKKLHPFAPGVVCWAWRKWIRVFWFFFSKKNRFLVDVIL